MKKLHIVLSNPNEDTSIVYLLYDGDNLIREYIPCYRKSDGKIGMYDMASGQFFTNAGTGEFLKGEDVKKVVKYFRYS